MVFSRGVSASIKLGRQRDKAGLGLRWCSSRARCPACGRCSCCCPAEASSRPPVWAREREAFICHLLQSPSGLTTTTVVCPGPRELRQPQAGEHPCFCLFQNWCKPQGQQQAHNISMTQKKKKKKDSALSSTVRLKCQDFFHQRRSNDILETKCEI